MGMQARPASHAAPTHRGTLSNLPSHGSGSWLSSSSTADEAGSGSRSSSHRRSFTISGTPTSQSSHAGKAGRVSMLAGKLGSMQLPFGQPMPGGSPIRPRATSGGAAAAAMRSPAAVDSSVAESVPESGEVESMIQRTAGPRRRKRAHKPGAAASLLKAAAESPAAGSDSTPWLSELSPLQSAHRSVASTPRLPAHSPLQSASSMASGFAAAVSPLRTSTE